MTSGSNSPARTVHLDDAALEAILDRLDESSENSGTNRRTPKRYNYRLKSCVVHLQQPGDGSSRAFSAPTRNLSAEGMSFVHGGFVHKGSRCMVQLISHHGSWENVKGTVTACEHLEGAIHEIHARFDHAIDPGMYCADAVNVRVLLVEDDQALAKLCTMHLQRLNAEVDHVENGQAAVEKAAQGTYDLIVMDIEMPVMGGLEATRKLRSEGYTGKIVAATALTRPGDREKCIEAGCDTYLSKPYTNENFKELFATLKQEPLFSSLADDESMAELIDEFVSRLPAKVRSIEVALAEGDMDRLESAVRSIKGEAGSFGFEPISSAAAKLEHAVADEGQVSQIKGMVQELGGWCALARAPSLLNHDAANADPPAGPAGEGTLRAKLQKLRESD